MDHGFVWSEGTTRPSSLESATPEPRPFEQGLAAEQERLRGFLRRIAGRPANDLDDLVQETLTRALRYRDSFDGAHGLWPWLKRIALRVHLDQRPLTTRPRVSGLESVDDFAVYDSPVSLEQEALQQLLSRLPEVERQVLTRFHQEGDSVLEIALALGLPEGTVKSHLHRARRRLAQENSEDMDR